MSVEQELKNVILSKYNSIREFSTAINMPYSTLDSIFKRGILKASVTNIICICNELSISVDDLAAGTIRSKSNSTLSKVEEDMLNLYRSMNRTGQDIFLTTIRSIAGNPDMQKGESAAKAI